MALGSASVRAVRHDIFYFAVGGSCMGGHLLCMGIELRTLLRLQSVMVWVAVHSP